MGQSLDFTTEPPFGRLMAGGGDVKFDSVTAIAESLNCAKVRYIVVGGLAVGTHGYLGFTNNVDLVIQLPPDNVRCVFEALEEMKKVIEVLKAGVKRAGKRKQVGGRRKTTN